MRTERKTEKKKERDRESLSLVLCNIGQDILDTLYYLVIGICPLSLVLCNVGPDSLQYLMSGSTEGLQMWNVSLRRHFDF